MKKYTSILPYGELKDISEALGEDYERVRSVVYGRLYDKVVIDEILKRYNKVVKSLKPVK